MYKRQYFHVTESINVDIMHDILEGVAPLEVKLMLRHFIYEEKLITLEQLNDRILSFSVWIWKYNKQTKCHNELEVQ